MNETLEQAALRIANEVYGSWPHTKDIEFSRRIADWLSEEQEPAGWIQPDHLAKVFVGAPFLCRVAGEKMHSDFIPFYLRPTKHKARRKE